MHEAASAGSAAVCHALIERGGADAGAATEVDAQTPLHLAAMHGHADVVEYLMSFDRSLPWRADARGRTALDLAEGAGYQDVSAMLGDMEEEREQKVRKWSLLLQPEGSADIRLDVAPPQFGRVTGNALELTCRIIDLEYRLVEYVLEVQGCDGVGPRGVPWRVYYARVGEQRKRDQVRFVVPRLKPCGRPLWEPEGVYQFRLTGRCRRHSASTLPGQLPWQITSGWSARVALPPAAALKGPRRCFRPGSRVRRGRPRSVA